MVALLLLVLVAAVALVHFVVRLNSAHRDREFLEALAEFRQRTISPQHGKNSAEEERRLASR